MQTIINISKTPKWQGGLQVSDAEDLKQGTAMKQIQLVVREGT